MVTASVCAIAMVAAACSSSSSGSATASQGKKASGTVTLVTHDSFAVSPGVKAEFERDTGLKLRLISNIGDAGSTLNQVILTKGKPLGDAFFGVDNSFLSRAEKAGIFTPYVAKGLSNIPLEYQLDPQHRVTPVDYGDVCINYDRKYFADHHLAVPRTFADLTKPAYKGQLVVENPATSSPGLLFLLATIAHSGAPGWQRYWKRLRANNIKVVDDWSTAYDSDFSGSSGKGPYPLVVSYASSPPAEVVGKTPEPAQSPVGTMTATCFRQVEFVGVLEGAKNRVGAKKLIDFMASEPFQADVPLQMYVWPTRTGTPLPTVFTKYADVPAHSLTLPAHEIGKHRDQWIRQWTNIVLR
ncbi:MAG TPA: thiamine ABC transporter substrate-binding protein [Acidimicrobiia bacterium]|jgi:thiamine transport system substrate-binding protein